jgi:hypothetical protein
LDPHGCQAESLTGGAAYIRATVATKTFRRVAWLTAWSVPPLQQLSPEYSDESAPVPGFGSFFDVSQWSALRRNS